jgi:membrane associated rhomboid family serine protease
MIPISDDNPTTHTAFINWAIVGLCVAVYLWEWSLGHQMAAAISVLGFVPAALFGHPQVLRGYIHVPLATLFTSMFVHGGLLHVAGNMLYLAIFGNNIEEAMGHVRYLFFYLLCGVAAALTLAWMDPGALIPMVGASGAISGVLAAYLLLYPRARVTVVVPLGIILWPFTISAFWVVGLWFLLQLASAMFTDPAQPGVAWWAHVGGFVMGLALTPLFKSRGIPLFGYQARSDPRD